MKTVFYIGNFSAPEFNAAGKRVYGNAKIFQELGYKVVCIGIGKNEKVLYDDMIFYSFVKTYNVTCLYEKIINTIRNEANSKDIIFVFYGSISLVLLNFMLLRYARKNQILTISDCPDWITDRVNNPIYNIIRKIDYNIEKRVFNKKIDGIILISSYLKKYYKKIPSVIIPPLNLYNIHKPNDSKRKNIQLVYAGVPFRIGQKRIKTTQMKDRLDMVIDLLNDVYSYNSNFDFNIYGITKKEYLISIPRHTVLLEKLNNIKFYGKIKSNELYDKISLADFTILLRDERKETMAGFSTKISESIFLFTPVITNDTSDIKKYIIDGKNGFILDIKNEKDCIKKMIKILNLSRKQILDLKKYNRNNQIFNYKEFIESMSKFICCLSKNS